MQLPVDPARYSAFLLVMAGMAAFPGPANLFSIATGMRRGKAAVIQGVAGMTLATLSWFAAAALGLGAVMAAFPQAFQALTIAGGLYLIWMGLQSIRGGVVNAPEPPPPEAHLDRSALRDGFAVQLANPKALLFFGVVLPSFADPDRPLVPQLLLFAAATIGMDLVTMTAYGLGGAALAERMSQPGFRRIFRFAIGGLLIAAAALILLRR
ncbi:LysE family transporter [Caulobacter sp. SLTY]|uniref:LysE family translocator n=1 Tax=Caulobacter sp. SLTY TaxID=2683262 RepID=UPI0014122EA5|nr:LysE family translocator [Caulobacter sp. SLTY]NBB15670.1 LysE family transporter [Caulobacter sp. SLTY]